MSIPDISGLSQNELDALTIGIATASNALKVAAKTKATVDKNLVVFEAIAALVAADNTGALLQNSLAHQGSGCSDLSHTNFALGNQGIPVCSKCALLQVAQELKLAIDTANASQTPPTDPAAYRLTTVRTLLATRIPISIVTLALNAKIA